MPLSSCVPGPSELERAQKKLASFDKRIGALERSTSDARSAVADLQCVCQQQHDELQEVLLSCSGASAASRRARLDVAWHRLRQGRPAEALPLLRKAVADSRRECGEGAAETLLAVGSLALVLHECGSHESANEFHETALAGHESLVASADPAAQQAAAQLAKVLYLIAHFVKAAEERERGREECRAREGAARAAGGRVSFAGGHHHGGRRRSGFEPEAWEIEWQVGRANDAGCEVEGHDGAQGASPLTSPQPSPGASPLPGRAP